MIVIRTSLTREEAEESLRGLVRPGKGFMDWLTFWSTWEGRRPPEFVGWVRDGQFRLRRLFTGTGYYFPVLTGDIRSTHDGTQVRINLRPPVAATIWFLGIIAGMAYFGFRYGSVVPGVATFLVFGSYVSIGWRLGTRRGRTILVSALSRSASNTRLRLTAAGGRTR
jgi:hypothetical protein